MRVLGIDTSTMISTVTVVEDEKIIGDFNVNQEKTHSESLVPMIETLLNLLGLKLSDIDIFAISQGPGSFTGLRIGMTIAKTFAQVGNKKLIPVSTLKALALNSSSISFAFGVPQAVKVLIAIIKASIIVIIFFISLPYSFLFHVI